MTVSGWPEKYRLSGTGLWVATVVLGVGILAYALLELTQSGQELLGKVAGKPPESLSLRDRALGQELSRFLGRDGEGEREIDLRFPSDADVAFLIETLQSDGSERNREARISAARALVVIQDERGITPLLASTGAPGRTGEERAFACSCALEILRFLTREKTAAWIINSLEDKALSLDEDCRSALEEKLTWIRGDSAEVLESLISSELPRAKLYALAHLKGSERPDVLQAIAELTVGADPKVAEAARRWLDEQGLTVVTDEPGTPVGSLPPDVPQSSAGAAKEASSGDAKGVEPQVPVPGLPAVTSPPSAQ